MEIVSVPCFIFRGDYLRGPRPFWPDNTNHYQWVSRLTCGSQRLHSFQWCRCTSRSGKLQCPSDGVEIIPGSKRAQWISFAVFLGFWTGVKFLIPTKEVVCFTVYKYICLHNVRSMFRADLHSTNMRQANFKAKKMASHVEISRMSKSIWRCFNIKMSVKYIITDRIICSK